ncbi:hypothetical protein SAMN05421788_105108 [Filimonas lacunae]|uniref:Uncharacterized protein n=1 Tax=Filimonas lacunae TaxID=477680 RepID=A0A173MDC2_9BACT|nr:hypothetical protein [Filimonas lacunae]BAV05438.1 hypothetical protein FLA_1445 [Filimonas lacunae]SIT21135.1 hypothetical protein SAMN05421788_105108 [Filimonas lacunae]
MARLILNTENQQFDLNKQQTTAGSASNPRALLRNRSKKYMDLIAGLDTHNLTDTKGMALLMNAIQEEFGTAELGNWPLGIVAKCFLGHPYEVHTYDLSASQILHHYKVGEPLPDQFEKARTLAKHNAYALVEVYKDYVILIREDGSASTTSAAL